MAQYHDVVLKAFLASENWVLPTLLRMHAANQAKQIHFHLQG